MDFQVWRINGSAKNLVPKEEIGKFYSGDCYIVLYTYHSSDKKEDYFLTCWMGKDSIQVMKFSQVVPQKFISVILSCNIVLVSYTVGSDLIQVFANLDEKKVLYLTWISESSEYCTLSTKCILTSQFYDTYIVIMFDLLWACQPSKLNKCFTCCTWHNIDIRFFAL